MVEFVAGGGALDPDGKEPPIGGSCYLLDHEASSWFMGVDFGAKDLPASERKDRSDRIIALEEEYLTSHAGMRGGDIPQVPIISPRFSIDDEGVPLAGLPDDTIMRERRNGLLVLTHAHRDHSGALPYISRQYPHVRIAMTATTLALCKWTWRDELRIARRRGEKTVFDEIDIRRIERHVEIVEPGTILTAGPFEAEMIHNGHILGSIGVLVRRPVSVYFTGDTCLHHQRTVAGAELPRQPVEYLISESTYGGRIGQSRTETEQRLVRACEAALERGGKVLCPVLAIARTQELIALFTEHGLLDRYPVFIDGSAREISESYIKRGVLPERVRRRYVTGAEHRNALLKSSLPIMVLAPSGMMGGGLVIEYALQWSPYPENLIALSCYQDPCSPGYTVLRARGRAVRFRDERTDTYTSVILNAEVGNFPLSAHADGADLLRMIDACKPRTTMLVHGDEHAIDALRASDPRTIHKTYIGRRYQIA